MSALSTTEVSLPGDSAWSCEIKILDPLDPHTPQVINIQ